MKPARILLTNDDGIDAPGLAILEEVARELCGAVWVVAPEHDRSGASQRITITEPLRVWPRGERRWAISGMPGDCVALALSHFMKDAKPDLILSGVNAGCNLGDEVNLSGTLGAVFTGQMLGIPSIGISQCFTSRQNVNWDTARTIAAKMLRHFLAQGWPDGTCLSINIPDLPADKIKGFAWARQSRGNIVAIDAHEREDQREGSYYWLKIRRDAPPADATQDYDIVARGEVAVTALVLDRSVAAERLQSRFKDYG